MHALDAAAVRTPFAAPETTVHRNFKLYLFLQSICAIVVADGLLSPNPCRLGVDKGGACRGSDIISWMARTVVWV